MTKYCVALSWIVAEREGKDSSTGILDTTTTGSCQEVLDNPNANVFPKQNKFMMNDEVKAMLFDCKKDHLTEKHPSFEEKKNPTGLIFWGG